MNEWNTLINLIEMIDKNLKIYKSNYKLWFESQPKIIKNIFTPKKSVLMFNNVFCQLTFIWLHSSAG